MSSDAKWLSPQHDNVHVINVRSDFKLEPYRGHNSENKESLILLFISVGITCFLYFYILTSIIHPPVVLAGLCCTESRDSGLRTSRVDPCHLAVSHHAWTPCTGRGGRWRENHRTGQRHLARHDDARSGHHGAVVGNMNTSMEQGLVAEYD